MDSQRLFNENGLFKQPIDVFGGPSKHGLMGSMFFQDGEEHSLTVDFKFIIYFPSTPQNIMLKVEITKLEKIDKDRFIIEGEIKKAFKGKWKKGKMEEEWQLLDNSCFTINKTLLTITYNTKTRLGVKTQIYKSS